MEYLVLATGEIINSNSPRFEHYTNEPMISYVEYQFSQVLANVMPGLTRILANLERFPEWKEYVK